VRRRWLAAYLGGIGERIETDVVIHGGSKQTRQMVRGQAPILL